jgi:hypothetical protein
MALPVLPPYRHQQNYAQVYFDTNRMIRDAIVEAESVVNAWARNRHARGGRLNRSWTDQLHRRLLLGDRLPDLHSPAG